MGWLGEGRTSGRWTVHHGRCARRSRRKRSTVYGLPSTVYSLLKMCLRITLSPMPPVDVLAIFAHRDDAELTCGGTLAKLARAGRRTAVLDLTQREMGTRLTPPLPPPHPSPPP